MIGDTREKNDPTIDTDKDKQIYLILLTFLMSSNVFEVVRKVGEIKRILGCLQQQMSTFWEFQFFTTIFNYKISNSAINFTFITMSTSTIKFTSIDVSLWLEVWQEMWWAGEGERPTMELEKRYRKL